VENMWALYIVGGMSLPPKNPKKPIIERIIIHPSSKLLRFKSPPPTKP
jgi:hypothetical protein